jgi:tol-pal system protein YbgF
MMTKTCHAIPDRTLPGTLKRVLLAVATTAAFAGCATTPPEQDPVVQRLTEMDGRLLRLERVLTNQSLMDMAQRIDAEQAELRALRGKLEELEHTVGKSSDAQREMYGDVDRRLSSLEGGGSSARSVGGSATPAHALPVPQGDDRQNYQAAFDLLKDGKYQEAVNGFKQYLATFPNAQLADNAQYWLGEAHYVMKEFPEALRNFKIVMDKYPESRKIPDALLKIGYCNYELKNFAEARNSLNRVVQQYADTTAARLAQQRLAKMEGEGR